MSIATIDQDRLLLTVQDIAKLTGLGVRTIWRLVSTSQFPEPVKIGRATRWKADEVRQWCATLN